MTQKPKKNGFSLIELTIVMTIAGLLIAAGAALYDIHQKKKRVDLTNERIESAQASLLEYARRNNFYPCPAPIDVPIDAPGYATATDCNAGAVSGVVQVPGRGGRMVRIGALPTRTLGSSGQIGLDGWNQRLIYAVTQNLAVPSAGINQDEGAITIIDSNDQLIADGTAHYILISPGPDGKGAYTNQGGLISACNSAPGKDTDNCMMNSSTFRSTENRATLQGVNHYDDFVGHAIDLEISTGVPPGAVMAFRSTVCPAGWREVPDLSGRAIVGTGTLGSDTYNLEDIVGQARQTLTVAQMPSHAHPITIDPPNTAVSVQQAGNHLHRYVGLSTQASGGSGPMAFWSNRFIVMSSVCSGAASTPSSCQGVVTGPMTSMPVAASAYRASSNAETNTGGQHTHSASVNIAPFNATTNATGGGGAFDIRQPSQAFLYCEKE